MREAGSSAAQEIAFTVANGLAYIEAALAAGLSIDQVAPRMSFFFSAHSDLFEEVAKFRAARRLWAHLIRERYAPRDPRSEMVRFHTRPGGHTDRAAATEQRRARGLPGLVSGPGWDPELHTNSYDEALGCNPGRGNARVADATDPGGRDGSSAHRPAGWFVFRREA